MTNEIVYTPNLYIQSDGNEIPLTGTLDGELYIKITSLDKDEILIEKKIPLGKEKHLYLKRSIHNKENFSLEIAIDYDGKRCMHTSFDKQLLYNTYQEEYHLIEGSEIDIFAFE